MSSGADAVVGSSGLQQLRYVSMQGVAEYPDLELPV